jgi:hypothetical protein
MPQTRPFFRHVHHATGIMARAPEPERYPYHFRTECTVGQKVKKSGDWQYYLARLGEERAQCPICAKLHAAAPAAPSS